MASECLEEYRTTLSANCISALEQFIIQEGQDGSLDREVADQETTVLVIHSRALILIARV